MKKSFKKVQVKLPKVVKPVRMFESLDGVVVIDKNGQICDGDFVSTHRGRPVKIIDNLVCTPVTIRVENTHDDGYHMEFDRWEALIDLTNQSKEAA